MRERLVDKFCRCVKKVKKTFRSEGPSIAICTKSVLQKRRRTLRKVRCRKHILVTQPMKGGEMIAMGADTPVFYDTRFKDSSFPDPSDVESLLLEYPTLANPSNDTWLVKMLKKYRPVVRLVPDEGEELPIHTTIKEWLEPSTGPYLDSYVKMHTNVYVEDGLYLVDIPTTYKSVPAGNLKDKLGLATKNGQDETWYGLLTRHQKADISRLEPQQKVSSMKDILKTLLHIDGRFVHYDLHMGNAAIMDDGTVVIHDFGRSKIRDFLQKHTDYSVSYPKNYNDRIFRADSIHDIADDSEYSMKYGQFFYIARYFVKEKGAIESKGFKSWLDTSSYDPAHPEKNLIKDRNPRVIPEDGRVNLYEVKEDLEYDEVTKIETIVRWSAEHGPYYMEPKYETRYHQIARIFDILSVLKPLHDYMGTQFTEASRVARDLLMAIHSTPPTASAERVREILVTHKLVDTSTIEADNVEADAYWKSVNPARNGKMKDPAPTEPQPTMPEQVAGAVVDEWDSEYGGPKTLEAESALKRRMTDEQLKKEAAEPVPDFKGHPEMADIVAATKKEPVKVAGRRSFKKKLPRLM